MDYLYITDIVKSQLPEGHDKDKICYFIEYYCLCKWLEKGVLEIYPFSVHVILHMLEDELKNYPNSSTMYQADCIEKNKEIDQMFLRTDEKAEDYIPLCDRDNSNLRADSYGFPNGTG